ncbi:MAG: hypothetical protein WC661_19910 [Opitutaceae bacterium]|jgi:hypothetical protein
MKKISLLVLGVILLSGCAWKPFKTYNSPDGKYKLEVFRKEELMGMPGQSGDAPGKIRLSKDGIKLKETRVEMVSMVEEPVWTDKTVYIHLLIDWSLEK